MIKSSVLRFQSNDPILQYSGMIRHSLLQTHVINHLKIWSPSLDLVLNLYVCR